jgi:hypothetical protein
MRFMVSSRRIVRAMLLAALVLTFASLAGELGRIPWGRKEPLLDMVLAPLKVGADTSIPTWYSSIALLLCSVLLATIAATKKRQGERYATHWGVLSAIFLILSVDEVARIHEMVGNLSSYSVVKLAGFSPGGFVYYFWVVPGAVFVLAVLLAYARFLLHLPRRTRLLLLVAGGVFVAGAIGVEMLGSRLVFDVVQSRGKLRNASVDAQVMIEVAVAIEELLEMLGVVILVYALLSYTGFAAKGVTLRFRPDDEP